MRPGVRIMRQVVSNVIRHDHGIAFVLLVTLCGVTVPGCEQSTAGGGDEIGGSTSMAQPVRVATVRTQSAPLTIPAIGTVEAMATVTIRPQVDGRLTKVNFADGREVDAGDVLFEIDPRPSQAALQLAQANLARDQALAEDAKREAQRMERLYAKDNAAERERNHAEADADAKAAQVRADQAMVEQAEQQLEYCTIHAPIAGRVGARLAEVGDVVKANDTALVVLKQIHPIYVSFSVAESHLTEIRRYAAAGPLTVEALFPPDDTATERGTLTFIDNQVDRNTGMIRMRGTFSNKDKAMWPGQYVDVSLILTTRPNAIVVPTRAVQAGPHGQYVFVVKPDKTVEMTPVKIADALDDSSVVESGLSPGQEVVTDGQLRLAPGSRVTILTDASTSASELAARVAAAGAGASQ